MAGRTRRAPRTRRPPQALSRTAFRWPAAARRDRPRTRHQATVPARGRADRQSRRGDRRRRHRADQRSRHANRLRFSDGHAQRPSRRDARPPGHASRRSDRMTRLVWILAVLLSHWRRHPMQLATLLVGLMSATALWSGVQALNQQARVAYDRAAAVFGGTRTAMLVTPGGGPFSQKLFVDLRRAGWPVSPVLEGRIQVEGHSLRLLGIDPVTLPAEVGDAPTIERAAAEAFVAPPGQTLIAPETLHDLRLSEGSTPETSG